MMPIFSDLTIRPTRVEDAPFLIEWLSDPSILRWFPMFDAREIEDAVRIWIGYARMEAGLTVEHAGAPCGMANLYIQPFKKLAHTCLFSIIVKEQMRGQGIGKYLIEALMRYAQEKFHIETLHLEVYEGNPAFHLYKRVGFKQFGCQTRFIKDNDRYIAKIYMERALDGRA